jgi:hypothetical protein
MRYPKNSPVVQPSDKCPPGTRRRWLVGLVGRALAGAGLGFAALLGLTHWLPEMFYPLSPTAELLVIALLCMGLGLAATVMDRPIRTPAGLLLSVGSGVVIGSCLAILTSNFTGLLIAVTGLCLIPVLVSAIIPMSNRHPPA